jgi:NitT/TauT family transport system permease protein
VIAGEFMSSFEGLGHAIFKAGSLYIIPKVLAAPAQRLRCRCF